MKPFPEKFYNTVEYSHLPTIFLNLFVIDPLLLQIWVHESILQNSFLKSLACLLRSSLLNGLYLIWISKIGIWKKPRRSKHIVIYAHQCGLKNKNSFRKQNKMFIQASLPSGAWIVKLGEIPCMVQTKQCMIYVIVWRVRHIPFGWLNY